MAHPTGRRLDAIMFLCLLILGGTVVLWGCSQGYSPDEVTVLVADRTRTALAEMERRGLSDWAAYGETVANRVTYGGEMPGFWAYADLAGGRIYMSDRWLSADVGDRGLVLLHELWHLRTGIVSHPQELLDLLAVYQGAA